MQGYCHAENELPYQSSLEVVDLVDDAFERGSSKIALLTPKTETPDKKRKAEGESDARKVNHRLSLSSPELRTLHFTPEYMSQVSFRQLLDIVGTASTDPLNTKSQQGVVNTRKKKSKKKLTLPG